MPQSKTALQNRPLSVNAVQILEDAEQIFPAVYRMIAAAENRIFLEMYLLEGEIGLRIIRQLREKAAQGVDVRLLYQPPVTLIAYKKFLRLLKRVGLKTRPQAYRTFSEQDFKETGIRVAPFPLRRFAKKTPLKMAHAKVLLMDGRQGMIGGMNFASITERNHDVMVRVRGPIVAEMEDFFLRNWRLAVSEPEPPSPSQPEDFHSLEDEHVARVGYFVTLPYLENTKALILDQIRTAQKRVLVEMYLLSEPRILADLMAAHRRGIDVRVLLDANRLPLELDLKGFPNKRAIGKLLKAGLPVRVYRCLPGQEMHLKMALFDDDRALIGSTNWTVASFTANSESCFFIHSAAVNKRLRAMFERDWQQKSDPPDALTRGDRLIAAVLGLFESFY